MHISSGDSFTHCYCYYGGFAIWYENGGGVFEQTELAGSAVTAFLQKLLIEKGLPFNYAADLGFVRDIKEKHAFVALNYEDEMEKAKDSSERDVQYIFPDKTEITIPASVLMTAAELIFNPKMNGHQCMSLPE